MLQDDVTKNPKYIPYRTYIFGENVSMNFQRIPSNNPLSSTYPLQLSLSFYVLHFHASLSTFALVDASQCFSSATLNAKHKPQTQRCTSS